MEWNSYFGIFYQFYKTPLKNLLDNKWQKAIFIIDYSKPFEDLPK